MTLKFLPSPFLFAALVGLHASLFVISNNWFMLRPSMNLFAIGLVTLTTFILLAILYITASFFFRKIVPGSSDVLARGLLILAGAFVWVWLLRDTFRGLLSNHTMLVLLLGLIVVCLFIWSIKYIQLSLLNAILLLLCFISFATTLVSIASIKTMDFHSVLEPAINQNQIDQWVFPDKRHVYYIVPDAYPNRQALEEIYGMNNDDFYRELESQGFTLSHSAYSNYVSTLPSVSSLFGMGHHYYTQHIGNHETLGAREFITGFHNPTMEVFRNNGYQIHLVHQTNYLLKKRCFVDTCSPSLIWDDVIDFFVPYRVRNFLGLWTSSQSTKQRILQHLEMTTKALEPQFTYVHLLSPGHSLWAQQSKEELRVFREKFVPKIRNTNDFLKKMIHFIVERDPNALIIINADHGGFGMGWWGPAKQEIFRGVPENLTALDHMGVLLAIRWPETPAFKQRSIQSNVNLFRFIFAYLSGEEGLMKPQVPDHGYLRGQKGSILQVIQDGQLLKSFEKIEQ